MLLLLLGCTAWGATQRSYESERGEHHDDCAKLPRSQEKIARPCDEIAGDHRWQTHGEVGDHEDHRQHAPTLPWRGEWHHGPDRALEARAEAAPGKRCPEEERRRRVVRERVDCKRHADEEGCRAIDHQRTCLESLCEQDGDPGASGKDEQCDAAYKRGVEPKAAPDERWCERTVEPGERPNCDEHRYHNQDRLTRGGGQAELGPQRRHRARAWRYRFRHEEDADHLRDKNRRQDEIDEVRGRRQVMHHESPKYTSERGPTRRRH